MPVLGCNSVSDFAVTRPTVHENWSSGLCVNHTATANSFMTDLQYRFIRPSRSDENTIEIPSGDQTELGCTAKRQPGTIARFDIVSPNVDVFVRHLNRQALFVR